MTTKKTKILPIKVWLDQDSCWTEKPQGDGYTEYVRVDYHSQALLHVLHKGVEQGKRQVRDKIENLIKEWRIGNSAEAKYRCEAYQELLDLIEKEE